MRRTAWVLVVCVGACGNITRKSHDAGVPSDASDAGVKDGMDIDAFVQPPPTPAREVINAAGRMTGATYTLDVEIGVPFQPQKATGGTYTIQPNTAVQP